MKYSNVCERSVAPLSDQESIWQMTPGGIGSKHTRRRRRTYSRWSRRRINTRGRRRRIDTR